MCPGWSCKGSLAGTTSTKAVPALPQHKRGADGAWLSIPVPPALPACASGHLGGALGALCGSLLGRRRHAPECGGGGGHPPQPGLARLLLLGQHHHPDRQAGSRGGRSRRDVSKALEAAAEGGRQLNPGGQTSPPLHLGPCLPCHEQAAAAGAECLPVERFVIHPPRCCLPCCPAVGYGDILPWSSLEVGVCMLVQLLGICFFGALLSSIAAIIQRASKAARRWAARLAPEPPSGAALVLVCADEGASVDSAGSCWKQSVMGLRAAGAGAGWPWASWRAPNQPPTCRDSSYCGAPRHVPAPSAAPLPCRAAALQEKLAAVEKYMRQQRVPREVRHWCRSHGLPALPAPVHDVP